MPSPRKIDALPPEKRAELNRRIVENGFGGYEDLSDWLAEDGFEIGKSTIGTHGQLVRQRQEQLRFATEMSESLLGGSPDDTGSMSLASMRMAQERVFRAFMENDEIDLKELTGAMTAIARVARADLALREDRRKVLADASAAAGKAARKAGLSEEGAAAIRAAIERTS